MRFRDRAEAGTLLGARLQEGTWNDPVVLGLPRGGVPVAEQVVAAIGGELSVIVTRKIGAPFNREMAIGAVGPDGKAILDWRVVRAMAIDESYIRDEVEIQTKEIARRMAEYCGDAPPPMLEGRDVILVDDGIATGHTISAAAGYVRRYSPAHTVIAAPVCPPDVFEKLRHEVDMTVSLLLPARFMAVGQFYDDFSQVSDADVRDILARARQEGND
ncbi:MAG: phosphoribosyltransferase family protein [Firmicutes bacterium]|jgi:putative phosphoribosyl transferase|nr:phosphoribosyltransferase family protein [Bacillota bacterium]MDD4335933.1 phosphoribosyltransferase family protein [Bacillota bacterium]MDD4791849.1 phosphoribosyltransferase family protein [Bacillota bacterium]